MSSFPAIYHTQTHEKYQNSQACLCCKHPDFQHPSNTQSSYIFLRKTYISTLVKASSHNTHNFASETQENSVHIFFPFHNSILIKKLTDWPLCMCSSSRKLITHYIFFTLVGVRESYSLSVCQCKLSK